jgi:hypothetical protein
MTLFKFCVNCAKPFSHAPGEEWKTQCVPCYYAKKQKERTGAEPKTNFRKTDAVKIPADMLHKLIMLCHPDKHKNSELSTNVTSWLLEHKQKNVRNFKHE